MKLTHDGTEYIIPIRETTHQVQASLIAEGTTPYMTQTTYDGAWIKATPTKSKRKYHTITGALTNCEGTISVVDFQALLMSSIGQSITLEDDHFNITGIITNPFDMVTNIDKHLANITIEIVEGVVAP
jgi:hypothetical protein